MTTAQSKLDIRRGGVQALALVAVGALGLSLGRWVIPDSAPAIVNETVAYSSSASPSRIIERKFAQMDARDARFPVAVAEAAERASTADVIEVKLAQMDAQDSRNRSSTAAKTAAAEGERILEVKFAQMDAEDSALSAR